MTIGERIRHYRKQRGITQNKLAELAGIHPVSIRKYETNKMQPQLPQIQKLAIALHICVPDLVTDSNYSDLKLCPFCGCSAEREKFQKRNQDAYKTVCSNINCMAHSIVQTYKTPEEADAAWNHRV